MLARHLVVAPLDHAVIVVGPSEAAAEAVRQSVEVSTEAATGTVDRLADDCALLVGVRLVFLRPPGDRLSPGEPVRRRGIGEHQTGVRVADYLHVAVHRVAGRTEGPLDAVPSGLSAAAHAVVAPVDAEPAARRRYGTASPGLRVSRSRASALWVLMTTGTFSSSRGLPLPSVPGETKSSCSSRVGATDTSSSV